jgi:uncharacterized membrane protein YdjX (TVP38/TMEM64 family)
MSWLRNRTVWRWAALGLVVLGLFLISRFLPFREWITLLTNWAKDQGTSGKFIFAGAYVVGTVLCLWGALFTIASGIAFGLFWGTVVSWLSATTGAALAFLIARYLARNAIEKRVGSNEKFKAIDNAIGKEGWKIVALLRLSPLIPFNLSNYLYGLTKIGFWPYVFASLIAMLPGTFLYVYLGHIGKLALTGGDQSLGSGQYVLLGGGLLFTIGIALYIARLAKRALAQADEKITKK